jgi:hypothetical protein
MTGSARARAGAGCARVAAKAGFGVVAARISAKNPEVSIRNEYGVLESSKNHRSKK